MKMPVLNIPSKGARFPSPVGGRQGEPERTHSNGSFRKNEVFPFLLMGSDTFYADIRYFDRVPRFA